MSIFGLSPSHPLPQHWTPLEAMAIVKCLDQDGEVALDVVSTSGLSSWEMLGMLEGWKSVLIGELTARFQSDEESGEP